MVWGVEAVLDITASQPHAAYTAYTHGMSSKWSYLSRTMQGNNYEVSIKFLGQFSEFQAKKKHSVHILSGASQF